MGYQSFSSVGLAPINIVIGKNDTGKTGLLKLLYATCRTVDLYTKTKQNEDVALKKILAEKLKDTFQPGKKGLGELVNKSTKQKLRVEISYDHKELNYADKLSFSFGEATTNTILDCQDSIKPISDNFRCLFLPAKEVLTSLKAIRATRDNLNIAGFDDTYIDLIRALVLPTQQGGIRTELRSVNKKLEDLFEGRIEQDADDDFIFKKGNTEFQMSMTAEGIKKIGILTTLIKNRQLNSTSVLFLDEPETTLHPDAIREMVEMLVLMAKAGIQIFIASHSYFVLKQLHLSTKREQIASCCLSLEKGVGGHLTCHSYDLTNDFPPNPISDEALKMADEEIKMDLEL